MRGRFAFGLFLTVGAACASGGSTVESEADSSVIPGPTQPKLDGGMIDSGLLDSGIVDAARPPIEVDAAIPPIEADASIPGGGGVFCDSTSDCEVTHCCISNICIRGEEIFGICIPD